MAGDVCVQAAAGLVEVKEGVGRRGERGRAAWIKDCDNEGEGGECWW